jgi:hypothetical protein
MRKHLLFGVVIASLLGLGAVPARPSSHRSPVGTTGADVQLTSAKVASGVPGPDVDAPGRERAVQGAVVAASRAAALQAVRERAVADAYLRSLVARRPVAPPPAPAPVVAVQTAGGVWAGLRQCESGGRYDEDTGNGYYGAYQFSVGTWDSLGMSGLPSAAPPAEQDRAAQQLQARVGWGQWPACARRLGLI